MRMWKSRDTHPPRRKSYTDDKEQDPKILKFGDIQWLQTGNNFAALNKKNVIYISNWDDCQEDDDLINQTFDQEGSQKNGILGQ